MENYDLLYGKAKSHKSFNIVSIEIENDIATIFCQDENGSTYKHLEDNKFWLLCNENPKQWYRLKGDLHYKWGKQFTNRQDFLKARQYLKTEDTFSIYDPKESFMCLKGYTYYKGLKPQDISVLSFDIETTSLEHNSNAKLLLISNTFRTNRKIYNNETEEWEDNLIIERKLFDFKEYKDEGEMIEDWCKWVQDIDPSILCGHNVQIFDLPYIQFIADKFGVEVKLGRNGSSLKRESYESKFRKDGSQFYHYNKSKVYGREIIDTMFLALKYDVGRKYESYGLKSIIKQENLEVKERQFYDAQQIRFQYHKDEEWTKIRNYAMFDADDSLALFDLMAPPLFYSAQMIPKSFQLITESAEGSKINSMMVRAYIQEGHSLPKDSESVEFEGAISIGNPGIYSNVYKVDVASLYPSIMIEYGVYDPDKDPNGSFLDLVKSLTEQRLNNKRLAKETGDRSYKDIEQAQKILINSCYGFLAANGLCFNSPKKASYITEMGRSVLTKAITWNNSKGFKLVNADTDSISFSKGDNGPITPEERTELLLELNSLFPERIHWEDDGYYLKLIVLKAKNYILQTEDGKVKIKGSSLKDQKKELALQEFLKEIINSILDNKNNYLEVYHKYVKEALNVNDIKRWCSKKTITSKVLNGERTNETKIKDAIANSEYCEGDKAYMFFEEDDTLKLAENFKGTYNKEKLLEKLYKTALTFESIIPKETFINYKLKRSKELLKDL